jgi:hypothetical protein
MHRKADWARMASGPSCRLQMVSGRLRSRGMTAAAVILHFGTQQEGGAWLRMWSQSASHPDKAAQRTADGRASAGARALVRKP